MDQSNKQPFEDVIEKNKASIYRICKVYAIAPIEPEDLFQEVIFQIWKSFESFEQRANMSTWVYRIALNVCIRQKTKLEKITMTRFDSIQFQVPSAIPDISMEEKYNALYDCIRTLKDIDQSIAILVLDELGYKEIAQITGLTENHIAVKMKRIRESLLHCINSKLR